MPTLDARPFASLAPEQLPRPLRELIEAAPLPSLADGPRDKFLTQALQTPAAWAAQLPATARAGLWLLAGDLDASHRISQGIDDVEGSFWHGIMHRREGDYSNAKYWFRRVGNHQVLSELATTAYGDSLGFIDDCQRACQGGSAGADSAANALMQLQWLEWQWLFAHCLR